MATDQTTQLEQLIEQIDRIDKENLEEILHKLIEAVQLLVAGRYRIYLEDLTQGALTCVAAAGGEVVRVREKSFPINDSRFLIAQVYQRQEELAIDDLNLYPDDLPITPGSRQAGASYMLPLTHQKAPHHRQPLPQDLSFPIPQSHLKCLKPSQLLLPRYADQMRRFLQVQYRKTSLNLLGSVMRWQVHGCDGRGKHMY